MDERNAYSDAANTAPKFLGKGFVVKREPSPPKYGKFSSEDVRYGPGIRNMMRGTQEVEVLKGRSATAYLRVQEASLQVLNYHRELGRCESELFYMKEELKNLDEQRKSAYLPKMRKAAFQAYESLRREVVEQDANLNSMREYKVLILNELKAALQRSDVAKQQLKNHFDMDGLFW